LLRNLKFACMTSLLTVCFAGAALAEGPQCEPDKVATKYPAYAGKVVKIAASPTQAPYAYIDPKNPDRLAGLEVEMIEGAMKCTGLKYEFVRGAWAGLLQSMFNGAADVMIGSVTYRPDRGKEVDFVNYVHSGQTAVVQKGNPKKIETLATLCGTTGSATVGGSSALLIDRESKACVSQGKPAINFQPASDADSAYRQVVNGRNDFAMDDAGSAAARVASDPNLQSAFTNKSDLESGFVVPKGNADMLRAVSEGLEVQEKTGALAALMKKYGLDEGLLIPIKTMK
jgi:polar amino acid transport system substrate-binding protein